MYNTGIKEINLYIGVVCMVKKASHLTAREYEIMKILWNSEKPMIISDILALTQTVAKNSLHPMINNLMKRKYIKVVGNIKVAKTYCRMYAPAITVDEYAAQQLNDLFSDTNKSFDVASFLSYLTKRGRKKTDDVFINEMEKFIESYKNENNIY